MLLVVACFFVLVAVDDGFGFVSVVFVGGWLDPLEYKAKHRIPEIYHYAYEIRECDFHRESEHCSHRVFYVVPTPYRSDAVVYEYPKYE